MQNEIQAGDAIGMWEFGRSGPGRRAAVFDGLPSHRVVCPQTLSQKALRRDTAEYVSRVASARWP